MKKQILMLTALSCLSFNAMAELSFSPVLKKDGSSGVDFSIPYKLGTHKGNASRVEGKVITDDTGKVLQAQIYVPITNLSTNNASRDCHMREALGIDYTHSAFPDKHVCDDNNQTPATGVDSIAYPHIVLNFLSLDEATNIVRGTLEIHGISKPVALPVQITKKSVDGKTAYNLKAQFKVLLSDYNIKVKPFTLGPAKIGVGNEASVNLDLDLE